MRFVKRGCKKMAVLLGIALLALCEVAQGQNVNFDTMSPNDIYELARQMLNRGNYEGAVAPLREVIKEFGDKSGAEQKRVAQACRLELARVYYVLGQTQSGLALVEEYLKGDPQPNKRLALRMMAQAFFETNDWDKVLEYAEQIQSLPNLEPEDRYNMNLLLGQAYFQKEEWEKCIDPLVYAEQNAGRDQQHIREKLQIMVARALVESEQWTKLFGWVRRLESSECRYDIMLNLTIMTGAEGLKGTGYKEDALNALYLYRMVLPREELIAHAEERKAAFEKEIAGAELQEYEINQRKKEIEGIDSSIENLEDQPPYEDAVTLSIGEIYGADEIQRYWEAFSLFNRLNREKPDNDFGAAAGYYAAKTLYDLKEYERAETRILAYLDAQAEKEEEGSYERELLMLMGESNLSRGKFDTVISLKKYISALPPMEAEARRNMKAALHYMVGLAYLQTAKNALACEELGIIVDGMYDDGSFLEDYEGSFNWPYALYYRGMGYMLQGKYQEAYDDFTSYLTESDADFDGEWAQHKEALFRQSVCLYGLERIKEAETGFTYFIENYKTHTLLSEAYSMRADLRVSKEYSGSGPHPLDLAQEDYDNAIKTSTSPLQALYPAKRSAEAYKLESKWKEIIERMDQYVAKWGEQADIAEAAYWKGQAYIRMHRANPESPEKFLDKAFDEYLDTIRDYGNTPSQLGVDKIILEMVDLFDQQEEFSVKNTWLERTRLRLEDAEKKEQAALALRWRVARALLAGDNNVKTLSGVLCDTVKDLTKASPSVLYLMCDAAVESGNLEQMTNYANYFIETFEESDLVWHGYRARVTAQMEMGQYEELLESADAVLGSFGSIPELGWAQMAKANALDLLGRAAEAYKAYDLVAQVPQWRSKYMGEAYCGMARSLHRQEGMREQALSWYVRTYLQCKAYENGIWAAKAYLGAADCLEEQGETEKAKATLQELLDSEYLNDEEHLPYIQEYIEKAEQRLGE